MHVFINNQRVCAKKSILENICKIPGVQFVRFRRFDLSAAVCLRQNFAPYVAEYTNWNETYFSPYFCGGQKRSKKRTYLAGLLSRGDKISIERNNSINFEIRRSMYHAN